MGSQPPSRALRLVRLSLTGTPARPARPSGSALTGNVRSIRTPPWGPGLTTMVGNPLCPPPPCLAHTRMVSARRRPSRPRLRRARPQEERCREVGGACTGKEGLRERWRQEGRSFGGVGGSSVGAEEEGGTPGSARGEGAQGRMAERDAPPDGPHREGTVDGAREEAGTCSVRGVSDGGSGSGVKCDAEASGAGPPCDAAGGGAPPRRNARGGDERWRG